MPAQSLPFYKLSPGGNPTILVRDNALCAGTAAAASSRSAIARALMDADHLGAEQVGFLDTSRTIPHMEMMGGEFCVNAARSAAFVLARMGRFALIDAASRIHEGVFTTSGAENPVQARVTPLPQETDMAHSAAAEAAIAVSLPEDAPYSLVRNLAAGETLVRLPGITHLLLDGAVHPLPASPLEAAAAKRAERGLNSEEAAGVIWHTPLPGQPDARAILPVVYVSATRSAVTETACGSGSLATALLLARENGMRFSIRQPSGHNIVISLEMPSPMEKTLLAWISGIVTLSAEGSAFVSP